jgi:two-component system sensor histidine kinase QseC
MISIRQRLLRNVMLLFLVSWLGVTAVTYLESRHEIEEIFDAQLAQAAGIISDLTLEHLDQGAVANIKLPKAVFGHHYERNISFQIWRDDGLVLRSQSAPETRLSTAAGFSDVDIFGFPWRVFMLRTPDGRYTLYAAERYAVRDELIAEITRSALYPLLLALPLVALFIWMSIGRGLGPLKQLASEVAQRTPQTLRPLDTGAVPKEVFALTTALNALLQRLQEAFERETRFTADAAHELRTPLAGIKTHAQVAMRSTNDDERQAALNNILVGVNRSTRLIEQMLTLARLEPESFTLGFAPVELSRIVAEVLADFSAQSTRKGIQLGFVDACPQAQVCQISGYAPGLAIMLRNLIDNALRYTPEAGSIEIRLTPMPEKIELTVTDSGPGIPVEARARVFDRFYRRGSGDGQGCGLGLSIVQRIAQLHQAELRVEDAPGGQGLRVCVVFTRVEQSRST